MGAAGRINKFGDNGLLCDRAHSAQPGGRGVGREETKLGSMLAKPPGSLL